MTFVLDGRASDSELVEMVWTARSETGGSFISSATTQWEMVVTRYQGETTLTVRGPETQATPADFPAETEFFGIAFRLGTFMPHLPLKTVMDRRDLNLPLAGSTAFWLNDSAWQFPTYENADTFVAQLVQKGLLVHEPVVTAALQGQLPELSLRSIQYRFAHATGLTHQLIQQIERAKQAATLLGQGVSILDTVAAAGYFDQAHLTRALKRFMGQTPRQMARRKPAE